MASRTPDILDSGLVKGVGMGLGMDMGGQDHAGSSCTGKTGVSLTFPHGLGLSFLLRLSWSPCSQGRTVAERMRHVRGQSGQANMHVIRKVNCCAQNLPGSSVQRLPSIQKGGRVGEASITRITLAAGQPCPVHSAHRLEPWSNQGPGGTALLARHTCLFTGTSPPLVACPVSPGRQRGSQASATSGLPQRLLP